MILDMRNAKFKVPNSFNELLEKLILNNSRIPRSTLLDLSIPRFQIQHLNLLTNRSNTKVSMQAEMKTKITKFIRPLIQNSNNNHHLNRRLLISILKSFVDFRNEYQNDYVIDLVESTLPGFMSSCRIGARTQFIHEPTHDEVVAKKTSDTVTSSVLDSVCKMLYNEVSNIDLIYFTQTFTNSHQKRESILWGTIEVGSIRVGVPGTSEEYTILGFSL